MTMPCQKAKFSLPADLHYLNCAYMSPLSQRVEAAGVAGIRRKNVPSDIVPDDFFCGPNRIRELFAQLIHAPDPATIAVVPAVSYGLATVARNTTVTRGQNVVTIHHQFPSNMYVWRRLCDVAGAELRVIAPPVAGPQRGRAWNDAIAAAIDDQTAAVAIAPIHWTDGTRFDLEDLAARARVVGAVFIVDGTQALGAAPFDVSRIGADAVVCAAYKWLTGPYSIGAAYFGPRFADAVPLEETWMGRIGSEQFGGLVHYQPRYRRGAARLDVGESSNFVLTPMLIAALEQVLEWGVANIAEYCRTLTRELFEPLLEAGFGIEEETWRSPHLFGLHMPEGTEPTALQNRLASSRVSVSVRGEVIRVSPHVYNDSDDVDALRRVLCS